MASSSVSAQKFACPKLFTCETTSNSLGQSFRITVNRTYDASSDPTIFFESYDTHQLNDFGKPMPTDYQCQGASTVTSYYVKAKNSNLYLTNSNSDPTYPSAIQSGYAASGAQSWNFQSTGAGNLWIRSMFDPTATQVLDVYGAGLSGTNVIIYNQKSPSGDANQRWIQTDRGSGYFSLHPSHDPTSALDVTGQSTSPGTQIKTWTYNGGDNQLWSKSPSCFQFVNSPYTCRWGMAGETVYTFLNFDGKGTATISKQGQDAVSCFLSSNPGTAV